MQGGRYHARLISLFGGGASSSSIIRSHRSLPDWSSVGLVVKIERVRRSLRCATWSLLRVGCVETFHAFGWLGSWMNHSSSRSGLRWNQSIGTDCWWRCWLCWIVESCLQKSVAERCNSLFCGNLFLLRRLCAIFYRLRIDSHVVTNRVKRRWFGLASVRLWKRRSGLGRKSTWCILSHFLLGWCRILILGPFYTRIAQYLAAVFGLTLWCLWNWGSFRWCKSICCFDWSCMIPHSHLWRSANSPKETIIHLLKIFKLFSLDATCSWRLSWLLNHDGLVGFLIWNYCRHLLRLILCWHSVRLHGTAPPELLRIHL